MGDWQLENLPWLPPAAADFRTLCHQALNPEAPSWDALRPLVGGALDLDQLTLLAKRWRKVRQRVLESVSLPTFRLGIVSNATTGLIVPALEATALRYGMDLHLTVADFGQTVQEALDPHSTINQAQPDAVLVALDTRGAGFPAIFDPAETGKDSLAQALERIETMRQGFRAAGCGPLILQSLAMVPEPLFGHVDGQISGTPAQLARVFNEQLLDSLSHSSDLLLDVAALAATVGLERWHDPLQWNVAKLPFAAAYIPLYADHLLRLIAAMRGKSRKCLVLDLDNTLWGGIIGDEGLEGLVLGQGDPLGEAFLAVQRMALALRRRGVVLAVCSKNEIANAQLPFEKHPEMVLKKEHIAIFQANWNDKASNLEIIAKQLNLGVDALVLLDDNPVERAQVRLALPEVAVVELPEDVALYPRTLAASGYFESVNFTQDDRQRADQYQANAARAVLQNASRDSHSFLTSLNMELTVGPFDAIGRSRITQLINKTNQFNLTTRRYTEAEVESITTNDHWFTFQARLVDLFGDNGMISVVMGHKRGVEWEIDTWVMSCRTINRRVEEVLFAHMVAEAKKAGVKTIFGSYLPSGRNSLVKDHYQKLGFEWCGKGEPEATLWCFEVTKFQAGHVPIRLTVSPP